METAESEACITDDQIETTTGVPEAAEAMNVSLYACFIPFIQMDAVVTFDVIKSLSFHL